MPLGLNSNTIPSRNKELCNPKQQQRCTQECRRRCCRSCVASISSTVADAHSTQVASSVKAAAIWVIWSGGTSTDDMPVTGHCERNRKKSFNHLLKFKMVLTFSFLKNYVTC